MTTHKYFVHESSCVDRPCDIGEGTKIWHFSHVMTGAVEGDAATRIVDLLENGVTSRLVEGGT